MTEKRISLNKQLKIHYLLLLLAVVVATLTSGPALSSSSVSTIEWFVSGLIIALVTCIPLLLFFPSIFRPNATGLSWYGFMLLAYVIWGVLKLLSPTGMLGGILVLAFTFSNFIYVVAWLRPLKKAAKLKKKAEEN